jgi:hypothetical protein
VAAVVRAVTRPCRELTDEGNSGHVLAGDDDAAVMGCLALRVDDVHVVLLVCGVGLHGTQRTERVNTCQALQHQTV